MENDLRGNENWFELKGVRVSGSSSQRGFELSGVDCSCFMFSVSPGMRIHAHCLKVSKLPTYHVTIPDVPASLGYEAPYTSKLYFYSSSVRTARSTKSNFAIYQRNKNTTIILTSPLLT